MFSTQILVQQMARGLAKHAAAQQVTVAKNLANADTPGFRAKRMTGFAEMIGDPAPGPRASRPSHLNRPTEYRFEAREERGNGNPNENSVSVEAEMMQAARVRQSHDMALAIQSGFSRLFKTALGRSS